MLISTCSSKISEFRILENVSSTKSTELIARVFERKDTGEFSSSLGPLPLYLNDVLAFMEAHGRKEWAALCQDIHYLATVVVMKCLNPTLRLKRLPH